MDKGVHLVQFDSIAPPAGYPSAQNWSDSAKESGFDLIFRLKYEKPHLLLKNEQGPSFWLFAYCLDFYIFPVWGPKFPGNSLRPIRESLVPQAFRVWFHFTIFISFSEKTVPRAAGKKPLNPLRCNGLSGFVIFTVNLVFLKYFCAQIYFTPPLVKKERFLLHFEEKNTRHCVI